MEVALKLGLTAVVPYCDGCSLTVVPQADGSVLDYCRTGSGWVYGPDSGWKFQSVDSLMGECGWFLPKTGWAYSAE